MRKLKKTIDQVFRDKLLENHMLPMERSIVSLTLLESIAPVSTTSLIHVFVWLSTAYRPYATKPPATLGRELFELPVGPQYEWPPDLRKAVLDSMGVPKSLGGLIPMIPCAPDASRSDGGLKK